MQTQMSSICERINKTPKLIKCVQALNEEEFITLNLENCYDEVDKIIVIVGAVQNHPESTENGLPIDNTLDLVKEFKDKSDPDKKIQLITINRHWANLEEIKQTFIDLIVPGDWIVIADVDEFYEPRDIDFIRFLIDRYPHATEFVPSFIHYYKDFEHAYVPGSEWQPQHQRIFKVQRGMKYQAHPTVLDFNGRDTYFDPLYWNRRFTVDRFLIHHYGYCRNNMEQILLKKQQYYNKELKTHNDANVPFNEKVEEYLDNTTLLKNILYVPKDMQPESIKKHNEYNRPHAFCGAKPLKYHEFYKMISNDEPLPLIWNCMTKRSLPYLPMFKNHINRDGEIIND